MSGRTRTWVAGPAVLGAIGLGVLVAAVVVLLVLRQPDGGLAGPSESGTASAAASSGSIVPSQSTAPSISTQPTPTATSAAPTPSPTPVLEPREGWQEFPVAGGNPYASVEGTFTSGGVILAYGRLDRDTLGVWRSSDGMTWEAAAQPPLPTARTGGSITDIVRTGEGFVAVALLGNPDGSEPYDTGIYRSGDGSTWAQESNPQTADLWIVHELAIVGDSLIVAGASGVWISEDDGRTWTASPANDELGGSILDLAYDGTRLVAVGYSGDPFLGETAPVMWTSTDDGTSWDRVEIDTTGAASHVLLGSDGEPIILGSRESDVGLWRPEAGGWTYRAIDVCCLTGAATTPTGFVAVGRPVQAGAGSAYVLSSTDGGTWSREELPHDDPRGVSWSAVAQLIVAADSASVLLGPSPYP